MDRPAAVQAKVVTSRSSASLKSSGALPRDRTFHRALPPKISPAPVVSYTGMPSRLGAVPQAFWFLKMQPLGPQVTNTSFTPKFFSM